MTERAAEDRWRDFRIECDRLVLRRFAPADAAACQRLCGDWDVARMVARVPYPYPDGLAEEFIESTAAGWAEGSDFAFAISFEGLLVGAVGLHDNGPPAFELGYWIGKPYWGKGFAGEAARAAVGFAFEALSFDALTAGYFLDNPASGRVLEKLGFKEAGREERWCEARQDHVSSRVMMLDRATWEARR